jgi:hypothetical protein
MEELEATRKAAEMTRTDSTSGSVIETGPSNYTL